MDGRWPIGRYGRWPIGCWQLAVGPCSVGSVPAVVNGGDGVRSDIVVHFRTAYFDAEAGMGERAPTPTNPPGRWVCNLMEGCV